MVKYFHLSVLLFTFSLGCSHWGYSQEPKANPDFIPLAVGNRWEYRMGPKTIIVEVKKKETIGKIPCFQLVSTLNDKTSVEYLARQKEGLVRVKIDSLLLDPPLLLLNLPHKKGNSWEVNSKVGDGVLSGTFKTKKEEVKVGVVKYQAIRVSCEGFSIRGNRMDLTYWFAPKVGMVKQQVKREGVETILELKQFTPGP